MMSFKLNTSIVLISIAAFAMSSCTEEIPAEYLESEITVIMEKQQDAWNRGDVDQFMQYYENSDALRFISSQGMIQGHNNLTERYKSSYPDPVTMGKLLFETVEIIPAGNDHAYVIGKWTLIRENDQPGGYFTLLFAKTKEGWRIISDHTS